MNAFTVWCQIRTKLFGSHDRLSKITPIPLNSYSLSWPESSVICLIIPSLKLENSIQHISMIGIKSIYLRNFGLLSNTQLSAKQASDTDYILDKYNFGAHSDDIAKLRVSPGFQRRDWSHQTPPILGRLLRGQRLHKTICYCHDAN